MDFHHAKNRQRPIGRHGRLHHCRTEETEKTKEGKVKVRRRILRGTTQTGKARSRLRPTMGETGKQVKYCQQTGLLLLYTAIIKHRF